jgi:AcrR family transcriptional regulator
LENVRLQSYIVVSQAGHADAYEMFMSANHFRAPFQFRRVGDPMVGIWLHLGEQPVSIVAVFNETDELAAAKREVEELAGESFGRRLSVDGTFIDPTQTIPTWRLARVLYYVTGRAVEIYRDKQWVLPDTQPLPAIEFARRQIDALTVLKTNVDPIEREVLGLSQPGGLAVATSGDKTYIVMLSGTDRVIELDPDVVETAMSAPSLKFARLEQAIALDRGVSIRTVTVQRRDTSRTNDPVVEDFGRLWRRGRNFNLRQPPTRVSVDPNTLAKALATAHRRDMKLVQLIAERVTVGDQRGHRDPRSLRVAISTADRQQDFGSHLAACALPPGDPDDVNVQFISDPALTDGAALYEAAFGQHEPKTDFYEAPARSVIASVLGFIDDEIELAT